MSITVQLDGITATVGKLDRLDKKIRRTIIRKAVRAGGAPLVKAVRSNAPVDKKVLRKSVTQKVKAYSRTGVVMAIVGAKRQKDAATGRNPANYLHLVERGTKAHTVRGPLTLPSGEVYGAVQHPGARASRFVERSARQADSQAVSAFSQKLGAEVSLAVAASGVT